MPNVALFVTCVADQLFPDTGMAAVRLLEAAGARVDFPDMQTCCGQPAFTAGAPDAAAHLARHHLDVFAPYDAVVAPSGSCVAMVRNHFAELVPERRDEVDALAARTFELSEYLVDVLGVDDIGARIHAPVTVHDACHGLRGLRVADAPRTLLRRAGATIVEMTEADTCCGFGGVSSPLGSDTTRTPGSVHGSPFWGGGGGGGGSWGGGGGGGGFSGGGGGSSGGGGASGDW